RIAMAYALSPDGKTVATVQAARAVPSRESVTLVLADAATGKILRRVDLGPAAVPQERHRHRDPYFYPLTFSADGRWVAVGLQTGTAGVWEVDSGQERARFQVPGRALAVAFSPDGNTLAIGNNEGTVQL